jgi:ribose-phosphate pyrophosphokinase
MMRQAHPRPLVFALPGNEEFARRLADRLHADLGEVEMRAFPDGETYLRLRTDPAGREVVLVCTLDRPDGKFLPLLFAAHAARTLGASRVGLVAPYLAYLRQDRSFRPGEAVTSVTFARTLSSAVDWLVTVDPHLHRYASLDEVYTVPSRAVAAAPLLAGWIAANVATPVLIGPDAESRQWVSHVAGLAGAPFQVLEKRRLGDLQVEVSLPNRDLLSNRTPVLVDDIVSSARTMIETATHLKDLGCPPPYCVAVHAVFAADSYSRLADSAARIVTTNTVPHASNDIDVSALVAASVEEVLTEHLALSSNDGRGRHAPDVAITVQPQKGR